MPATRASAPASSVTSVIQPSREQFRQLARDHTVVPVWRTLLADFVTPVSALSGYARTSEGRLVAFSVLSRGLTKSSAVTIEDAIVRTIAGARLR